MSLGDYFIAYGVSIVLVIIGCLVRARVLKDRFDIGDAGYIFFGALIWPFAALLYGMIWFVNRGRDY